MKWIKKGSVFCADHTNEWALSHAAIPTPHPLNDTILRIYCAFRASGNVSRIGYVDVLTDNPKEIVGISSIPVLDIGEPGMFDDNGVVPHSILEHGNKLYLYYAGFQLGTQIPYTMFNGLAISDDGGNSFTRYQHTPITDRKAGELFFRTAAHVIKDKNIWHMWYVAGDSWINRAGKKLPSYSMKYLNSTDGLNWLGNGHSCFSPQGDEYGFGRPFVIKEGIIYRMYYSIRSHTKKYHLGYAESCDGKTWIRKDKEIHFDISLAEDSEMMCYSAVISHHKKTYLFYNGNDHGGTGILYAELEGC